MKLAATIIAFSFVTTAAMAYGTTTTTATTTATQAATETKTWDLNLGSVTPKALEEAIKAAIPGATVKVDGTKLTVTAKPEEIAKVPGALPKGVTPKA